MTKEEAPQHFRSVCEQEFQFLIEEFGFVSAPLPAGEFVNQFQFRLTNGTITLVVEGINWGLNATVGLEDNYGRSVGIGCLLPDWRPFAKQKRTNKKNQLSQDQQIVRAAQLLKEHGQDILHGELQRFNKIGDRLNNIDRKFREFEEKLRNSRPQS
jgi:hypothetical protein